MPRKIERGEGRDIEESVTGFCFLGGGEMKGIHGRPWHMLSGRDLDKVGELV